MSEAMDSICVFRERAITTFSVSRSMVASRNSLAALRSCEAEGQ